MAGFDFDLFVIGGGSGGVRAARVAAEAGARVGPGRGVPLRRHLRDPRLRAEEADGLCRRLLRRLRATPPATAGRVGASGSTGAALHRRQGRRDRAARVGLPRPAAAGRGAAAAVRGRPSSTRIGSGSPAARSTPRKHLLIATGARPRRPDIPGAELGVSSNEMFELEAPAGAHGDRRRRLYRLRVRRRS